MKGMSGRRFDGTGTFQVLDGALDFVAMPSARARPPVRPDYRGVRRNSAKSLTASSNRFATQKVRARFNSGNSASSVLEVVMGSVTQVPILKQKAASAQPEAAPKSELENGCSASPAQECKQTSTQPQ